ncbi:MAG: NEW3 domain-containing protein [Dehalococcoidales bacterium]|nr:NEW3 domain-containing protein [Dehalococcoidales bacterium]
MSSSTVFRRAVGMMMLVIMLVTLVVSPVAAQTTPTTTPNTLELVTKFPIFEGRSGDEFDFEVLLRWSGPGSKSFALAVNEDLPQWQAVVLGGYPQKNISAIGVEPEVSETITVKMSPLIGEMPEPGLYKATLTATSTDGTIKASVELTAKVIAKYLFAFYTTSGRLDMEATAGKENHLATRIQNTGSTSVTNVTFLATKPEGWDVKFVPEDVAQVDTGYASEIDVIVIPPRQVVPGDYMLTISSFGKEVGKRDIELRVTVLTPTVWGWVGVIIVLLVIAGLVFMFRQLGRR